MSKVKNIAALAMEAMLYEVSATPKPGLVDRHDSGAHADMDFFTFMSSATALRNYFDACVRLGKEHGADAIASLLTYLQAAGIVAERQMFAMTGGINTHKGMIFSLGLLCGAAGWANVNHKDMSAEALCQLVAQMTQGLCASAYGHLDGKEKLTKGEAMYQKYGVRGVRGEAEDGFPSVRHYGLPAYRQSREQGLNINDSLVMTLLELMANTIDTNILGRHDMNALHYAQETAKKVIALGGMQTETGKAALTELNRDFIQRWISPGGSADLVAVTHFLYEVEQNFVVDKSEVSKQTELA